MARVMARFVTVVSAVILAIAPVRGGDWPQWGGGSLRNLSSTEHGLPATFHPGKRRRDHLGIDHGEERPLGREDRR